MKSLGQLEIWLSSYHRSKIGPRAYLDVFGRRRPDLAKYIFSKYLGWIMKARYCLKLDQCILVYSSLKSEKKLTDLEPVPVVQEFLGRTGGSRLSAGYAYGRSKIGADNRKRR